MEKIICLNLNRSKNGLCNSRTECLRLLAHLKATVEGLLQNPSKNICEIYGGIQRIAFSLQSIFHHHYVIKNKIESTDNIDTSDVLTEILSQNLACSISFSQLNHSTYQCFTKEYQENKPQFKTFEWLKKCLKSYNLTTHLTCIANNYHLLFNYYADDAFLCQPVFFESMFIVVQSLESHDLILLSSVNLYKIESFLRKKNNQYKNLSKELNITFTASSDSQTFQVPDSIKTKQNERNEQTDNQLSRKKSQIFETSPIYSCILSCLQHHRPDIFNMLIKDPYNENVYEIASQIDIKNSNISTSKGSQNIITTSQADQVINTSAPIEQLVHIVSESPSSLPHKSHTSHDVTSKTDLVSTFSQFNTSTSITDTESSLSNSSLTMKTASQCKRSQSIKSKYSLHVRSSSDFNVSTFKLKQAFNGNNITPLNNNKPQFMGDNQNIEGYQYLTSDPMTLYNKTTFAGDLKAVHTSTPKGHRRYQSYTTPSLLSFISSFNFNNCTDLDRENAHFSFSEGLLQRIEEVKWMKTSKLFEESINNRSKHYDSNSENLSFKNASSLDSLSREEKYISLEKNLINTEKMDIVGCDDKLLKVIEEKDAQEVARKGGTLKMGAHNSCNDAESDDGVVDIAFGSCKKGHDEGEQRLRIRHKKKSSLTTELMDSADFDKFTDSSFSSKESSSFVTESVNGTYSTEDDIISLSLASFYSDADLLTLNDSNSSETSSLHASLNETKTSADVIAMNLIRHFSSHLPPSASRFNWLVSQQEAPQKLLPLPDSFSASMDHGVVKKKEHLRGTLDWAPPRPQIICTPPKQAKMKDLLQSQKNKCAGCGSVIEAACISRCCRCEYTGKVFCSLCKSSQKSIIPGHILTSWSFKTYPVSRFAYDFLLSKGDDPWFNVPSVLYDKVRVLRDCIQIRKQLHYANHFISTCNSSHRPLDLLNSCPTHWFQHMDTIHTYSLNELVGLKKKEFLGTLKNILKSCLEHINACNLCTGRGHMCEICRHHKSLLFHFQLPNVAICDDCSGIFHKKCFKSVACPKCKRLRDREMRKKDNDPDETYNGQASSHNS